MSSPERFLPVEDEMCRRADLVLGSEAGPTRVYLARRDFRHRSLVNRVEIEAIAKQRGFAIKYPEDLEFAEQARLLRNARFVVAPEGSAVFLSYFLSRGAKVCILNHPLTEAVVGYNGGCKEKGVELTVITGPEAGERRGRSQDMNYIIDADVFRGFLDAWLETSAI
jgi:capsular polysaccharide biosynthesis protein